MKLYLIILLFSFEAFANQCIKDAKKLCSSVEPGKGQLARCLSDYESNLSPQCAAELRNFKKSSSQKNPCFEDLAEFCSDLPEDPSNLEYCLIKNELRLSPKCSSDFKKKKGKIITGNLCAQDIVNNCYGELRGPEGAVNKCLIKNRTKLSGFCQKNIDHKISDMKKKNPCFNDTENFCPLAVKFIDIHDCLSKKISALSPLCKTLVEKENIKIKRNSCYRDLITHCRPGLNPMEQNQCLTLNNEHLSQTCKHFRLVQDQKIEKMVKTCEQDRIKLCKDIPMKDGAVLKCLIQKKSLVSQSCKMYL